jgi:hypothetical protein
MTQNAIQFTNQSYVGVVNRLVLQDIQQEPAQYFIAVTAPDSDHMVAVQNWMMTSVHAAELIAVIAKQFEEAFSAMSAEQIDWFEFQGYAEDWLKNRPRKSRADQLVAYPAYQRIIGMGQRAIPCILRRLQDELKVGEPNHWFWALWAITGAMPVREDRQGKIFEMARDWISWGESEGYINAEGVGGALSKSAW